MTLHEDVGIYLQGIQSPFFPVTITGALRVSPVMVLETKAFIIPLGINKWWRQRRSEVRSEERLASLEFKALSRVSAHTQGIQALWTSKFGEGVRKVYIQSGGVEQVLPTRV